MIKTTIAVGAASVATAAALGSIALYAHGRDQRQTDINKAVCVSVVRLDNAITQSLRRSQVALPKIQYYRQHPSELASQEADIRASLKRFVPPRECVGATLTRR